MLAGLALASISAVTTQSLLAEAGDLGRLAREPSSRYRTVQASSYDRASRVPGTPEWFANGDAGQYIRTEGSEKVMADWKGPGALVRLWSANATGTLRFYFDGEARPRIAARADSLLSGREPGFPPPLALKPQLGWNFYFPLPFAKSLKITAANEKEGDQVQSLYYAADARLYDQGVPVLTWAPGAASNRQVQEAGESLTRPAPPSGSPREAGGWIGPGESKALEATADRLQAVRQWEASWKTGLEGQEAMQALACLEARITVDGVRTASVPLGHFFGSPDLLNGRMKTLAADVMDGRAVSRLPIPFRKSLRLEIVNRGAARVRVGIKAWTAPSSDQAPWFLHASFMADFGRSRPMRDMTLLDVQGEGRYVGTVLQVQNPAAAWWGEGDEKVWVDGESFPSWFGTGTEDYFGYAWSHPAVFSAPYHAQPHASPGTNAGHIGNVRWHVMDDIPFRKSLKFQMEMWHWVDTNSRFSATAFWSSPQLHEQPVMDSSKMDLMAIQTQVKVKDALEGEDMKAAKTGGSLEKQTGFGQLSGGAQLWWTRPPEGSVLTVEVPVKASGSYRVKACFCHAVDYGVHQLSLDGQDLGEIDFYSDSLAWKVLDLGVHNLRKGRAVLKVTSRGRNPKSIPGSMFGLDYLLLERE